MKIYKIRRKSDGLFLSICKGYYTFNKNGKIWKRFCDLKNHFYEEHIEIYLENDCEIVEYETKETNILSVNSIIEDKINRNLFNINSNIVKKYLERKK